MVRINKTASTFLVCIFSLQWAFAQTTIDGSFVYDGILRTYRLYIPALYNPAEPVPLVFNLHGYGSDNIEQEFYGDFRPIADTANFIIAHPNGTLDAFNQRFWNTFGSSAVDDVGFLSALIDTISASYTIDPNAVYSTGMSNGGFMSYELACMLSDRITAVASVTGSMIWAHLNACNPLHPTPVMEIHGTADNVVPYNGTFLFAPIDTLVNRWVVFNGCSLVPEIIPVPDIDPEDGCTAELYRFTGGEQGTRVELYKVLGGGHSWPGAPFVIDVTNMDFSASVKIWQFFSQFTLNGLISGVDEHLSDIQNIKLYPNPSRGHFYLEFPDASEKRIIVTSMTGQLVHESKCKALLETVSLKNGGIYFVTVYQDDRTFREKVIVQ